MKSPKLVIKIFLEDGTEVWSAPAFAVGNNSSWAGWCSSQGLQALAPAKHAIAAKLKADTLPTAAEPEFEPTLDPEPPRFMVPEKVAKVLEKNGIIDANQLAAMTATEFASLDRVGDKAVEIVQEALTVIGLSFKAEE